MYSEKFKDSEIINYSRFKKIRLVPFFAAFNIKEYIAVPVTFAFGLVVELFHLDDGFDFAIFTLPLILSAVCFVLSIAFAPTKLYVNEGELKFRLWTRVHSSGFTRRNYSRRVYYHTKRISKIEFKQNFIEEIFDVGHIVFSGYTEYIARRETEDVYERKKYTIYGIRNFSAFRKELNEYIEKED